MDADTELRDHLIYLLDGGDAHMAIDTLLQDIPEQYRGVQPDGLPYTLWRLLEHMRIAQNDILEYALDPSGWESPEYPDGYWPADPAPPDDGAWKASIKELLSDNQRMQDLVANPETDLFKAFPNASEHTVLRQALLAADHNSYHIGQLFTLRRLLGLVKTDNEPPDNF